MTLKSVSLMIVLIWRCMDGPLLRDGAAVSDSFLCGTDDGSTITERTNKPSAIFRNGT